MRKITVFFLFWLMLLSFSGCSAREAIASHKQEYIVTAIGFSSCENGIKMILEAVVVNSDDLDSGKETRLFEGTGKTIDEAFSKINRKTTQPLMFSHTGAVILSDGLGENQIKEIYDFCYKTDEINLATMFVSTEDSEELLSCETVSSVGVGFDVMSLIEVVSQEKGIDPKNLFYEIENARNKPQETVYMPVISVENKEFFFGGIAVLRENKIIEKLNVTDSQLLCMLNGNFGGGKIFSGDSTLEIGKVKTSYNFDFQERLTVKVNLKVKNHKKEIEIATKNFLKEVQKQGKDVFLFGNEIAHKEPSLWKEIGMEYEKHFKNAVFVVNVYG